MSDGEGGTFGGMGVLLRKWAGGVVEQLREPVVEGLERLDAAASEGDTRMRRWLPVLQSARRVGRHLWQLGLCALFVGDDRDVRAILEELAAETAALVAAFPNIADVYEDVDDLDRWVDATLDKSGVDDALFRYLARLREFVDRLVERVVEHVFDSDDAEMSPERLERFLEGLDRILRGVMERWLADAIAEPGPGRPSSSTETDGESDPSTD